MCLLIANAAGLKKSQSPRPPGPLDFTLEDFLIFRKPDKPSQPADFMRSMFAGRVIKGKPNRKRKT